jgi:hypothetical protein
MITDVIFFRWNRDDPNVHTVVMDDLGNVHELELGKGEVAGPGRSIVDPTKFMAIAERNIQDRAPLKAPLFDQIRLYELKAEYLHAREQEALDAAIQEVRVA